MTSGLFPGTPSCAHCGHAITRAFTACACPCHSLDRELTAIEAREAAIAKVQGGSARTGKSWRDGALEVVGVVASMQAELTTDDLWPHLSPPPEPRALGAVIRRAVTAGLIEKTGRTVPSQRPENHGRDIRVWASAIYM